MSLKAKIVMQLNREIDYGLNILALDISIGGHRKTQYSLYRVRVKKVMSKEKSWKHTNDEKCQTEWKIE
jgi:hypothetical protein